VLAFLWMKTVNHYSQIPIFINENMILNASHFSFQQGSLVGSDNESEITKPNTYHQWRRKRKETFLAGRFAVQHAQVNLQLPTINILKAKSGSPIWPTGYTGSISHTDNQAIAVLLPFEQQEIKGIGIDIEDVDRADLLEDNSLIGHHREFQVLKEAGIRVSLSCLFLFSLKESIYKALYPVVGEFFDFLDVELMEVEEGILYFQVLRDLSETVQEGFILRGGFSYEGDQLLTWAYRSW